MKIYYLYCKKDERFVEQSRAGLTKRGVEVTMVHFVELEHLSMDRGSHLLVTGSISVIKKVLEYGAKYDLSVGIIPKPQQRELIDTFSLESNLEKSIELALVPSLKKIDLLYCNGELVLQEVVIGEVPPLDSFSSSMENRGIIDRIVSFITLTKHLKHLRHRRFKVITAKDKALKFSAIGAVGVEYNNQTFASKLISKHLKYNDGRLSLVVLAPSSILHYMGYIFQTHILNQTPSRLPSSVGYIHTKQLSIEAEDEKLPVTIDGDRCLETPIDLVTQESQLALSVGEEFWRRSSSSKEVKESVKIAHLPSDDETSLYLGKSIPLFAHASQERFTELFSNLREESSLNSTFMILLMLATMIAIFGLYINSASVIIGAMLLAPLMQPIVGVSMGLLRQDIPLLLSGMRSILVGVLAVIGMAVIISFLVPLEQLTSEMNGRLSPTILDMFVAIVSGIAAAYAKSNEKIVGFLAGVAIAVALVPPLAVSGVGLGWGAWSMFGLALLLFITNLVGIILAASLTFLVLGFSPIHVAKKGILYATSLVAVVSIPLAISFSHMRHNIEIQQSLSSFEAQLGVKKIHLKNIQIQGDEVRCEVIASDILFREEKQQLKVLIAKRVGEEVHLLVSFWYEL